jgi:hypothetical protein
MRIVVYEYLCAAGAVQRLPVSLRREGWTMLFAVATDLSRVAGVRVDTILEEVPEPSPSWTVHRPSEPEESLFRELATADDFTLVIAPEFDDILWTRCHWVERAGGRLLGPSADAVQRTGDKLLLARHLQAHGVATPPVNERPCFPAVWKPRFGAGSQATFLVHSPEELAACANRARAEGWQGEAVVQPFAPGLAASVAVLIGSHQLIALPPATQELSADGRFRYQGGTVPLTGGLAERAVALATRAVQTVPGLRGYVGVDLVLGEAADGSGDWVIEINPRLTTSYVGLRALAETNLAEAMVQIVSGAAAPLLRWRSAVVRFQADGRVESK